MCKKAPVLNMDVTVNDLCFVYFCVQFSPLKKCKILSSGFVCVIKEVFNGILKIKFNYKHVYKNFEANV